jgi:predicted NAD/FAD-binding protein
MPLGAGSGSRPKIAVVGGGISGLSAAWLLSQTHDVHLFEAEDRLGGHTMTLKVEDPNAGTLAIDAGFIVYNEATYPNLTALFDHLRVETRASDMSFAVSMDNGRFEYGSTDLRALFAQKRNLVNPQFWSLLADLRRFYADAPRALIGLDETTTLDEFLRRGGYGAPFRTSHILPQAAAIWSSTVEDIAAFPAASFLRFFLNHGLLELDVKARPQWRTVVGGSSAYIAPLAAPFAGQVRLGAPVRAVTRHEDRVALRDAGGDELVFDQVVLACHAPEALRLLTAPTREENALLGAIRYRPNTAVLHTDAGRMPRRRSAWSAWNFLGSSAGGGEITYWMNRLQGLTADQSYFVSLGAKTPPRKETVLAVANFEHPVFDAAAVAAQQSLWSLQGRNRTWFCGAYFGSGFHEDGLQSALAVAEALGGDARPWTTPNPSGRIFIGGAPLAAA